MLNFDLNSLLPTGGSSGGGSSSGLLGGISKVANAVPVVGGLISGAIDLFDGLFGGKKQSFENDSKPYFDTKINKLRTHIKNLYLNGSMPLHEGLTKADALLGVEIHFSDEYQQRHQNAAWKQGEAYHGQFIRQIRDELRNAYAGKLNFKDVSKATHNLGLSKAHNNDIAFYDSIYINYREYSPKAVVEQASAAPKQTVTLVTTTNADGTVTQKKVVSDAGATKSTGLIGWIVAGIAIVVGGVVYLFKKKK